MKFIYKFCCIFLILLMLPLNVNAIEIDSCQELVIENMTYVMNTSIIDSTISECMNISANNLILDCNGYIIDGNDNANYAIFINRVVSETTNITVKNCILSDWNSNSIYLVNADGNNITNISTSSSPYPASGINLFYSNFNSISYVTTTSSTYGVRLYQSNNNTITNVTSTLNTYGLHLFDSTSNIITNISSNLNDYGIHTSSNSNLNSYNFLNINSNLINGIFLDGSNNELTNLIIFNHSINENKGIHIDDDNNTISNSSIYSNYYNIYLDDTADNTTIKNSDIYDGESYGVYIKGNSGLNNPNNFFNNFFNQTLNLFLNDTIYTNFLNTTQQSGSRIYGIGSDIGGNYWSNPTNTGYSDLCYGDGYFCKLPYTIETNNTDYLALMVDGITTYSHNSSNTTHVNQSSLLSLQLYDRGNVKYYIFSFDNGNGTFINDSIAYANNHTSWVNISKTLNSTKNVMIQWKIYNNDSIGNWYVSETYTFNTTNIIPTIGTPTINDSTPYTNDSLLCTNGSFSDADGDTATWFYRWYDTNVLISGENNNLLDLNGVGLDSGDTIICSTIASDSYENATAWVNSTSSTIQYIPITNTPTITPTTAYTNNNLLCNATITDSDVGDTLTAYYKWYLNGSLNETGSIIVTNNTNTLISTVLSGNTTKNDLWICEITPNDGVVNGTSINSTTKTISNSLPTQTPVTITPLPAETIDNLTCNYVYADGDNDTINNTWYRWYIDGVLNVTTQNMSSTITTLGDNIKCSVKVSDGYENSSWVNSSELTLGDTTAPVLHTQYLSATTGAVNTLVIIGVNVTEANDLNYVYVEITNPNDVKQNITMYLDTNGGVEQYYTLQYIPLNVGVYTFRFYAQDGSGYDATAFDGISNYAATAAQEGGGGGGTTIITDVCGDGVCSVSENSSNCPEDCLMDYTIKPLELNINIYPSSHRAGSITLTNTGLLDKTFTVSVTPSDYLKISLPGEELADKISFILPRKVGLSSGEKTIEWELDYTDLNMSLGEYNYTITYFDGKNTINQKVFVTVKEQPFFLFDPIYFMIIFLIILAIFTFMPVIANRKPRRKKGEW